MRDVNAVRETGFVKRLHFSEPTANASADRGGYVEVDYGASGNVQSFTVHAQCRDASPTNVCYADDVRTTHPDTVRDHLRARCVCDAQTEQHVQLRWDELNRLVEARRFDRASGQWTIAVRQRHRYDGSNVRLIKETIDVDQVDLSLRQRIALSVIPGDFERVGVLADTDALEPTYRGSAALQTETQYAIAGARLVRMRGEEAGVLNARHRFTYGINDLIGSASGSVDLQYGELLETATFYPNGARETHRATTKAGTPLETSGFTGKEESEEVGLTYFGERWLIARVGRWASPDPIAIATMSGGEAGNSYHYVAGNILQANDPTGLDPNESIQEFETQEEFEAWQRSEDSQPCRSNYICVVGVGSEETGWNAYVYDPDTASFELDQSQTDYWNSSPTVSRIDDLQLYSKGFAIFTGLFAAIGTGLSALLYETAGAGMTWIAGAMARNPGSIVLMDALAQGGLESAGAAGAHVSLGTFLGATAYASTRFGVHLVEGTMSLSERVAARATPRLTVSLSDEAVASGPTLSTAARRSIRSIETELAAHEAKLTAYRQNPFAFDNQGHLARNATRPDVQQRIIDGRIRHLEGEIQNFQRQLERLRSGGVE